MEIVRLFKQDQQQWTVDESQSSILPLVNRSNSKALGAGMGLFVAGCHMEWTVSYDEVLFIHDGELELVVNDKIYQAAAGDVLWIPEGTALTYSAPNDVKFFYAVYPLQNSPSTGTQTQYPHQEPLTLA